MMRQTTWIVVLLSLALNGGLAAQQGTLEQRARIAELIEQLGSQDDATRRSAERELRSFGDLARGALKDAAQDNPDPDVQGIAKRILKGRDGEQLRRRVEVDGGDSEPEIGPQGRSDDLGRRIEEMMRRMDEVLGPDGRAQSMRDMMKRFEEMEGRLDGGIRIGSPLLQRGTSSGTQIEIGPGGVRVEIEERGEDGEAERKVYEAEDMDAFREKYPEVAERVMPQRLRMTTPWLDRPGRGALRGLPFPVSPRSQGLPAAPPVAAPPGERLGVFVDRAGVAPAVLEYLGLEPGQGLLVESVQDGSLADQAGVRAGDLVIEVAGRKVFSARDVAAALRGITIGTPVEVRINRRGATLDLEAEKVEAPPVEGELEVEVPEQPSTERKRLEKKSGGSKGR